MQNENYAGNYDVYDVTAKAVKPDDTAQRKVRRALEGVVELQSAIEEIANQLVGAVPQACGSEAKDANVLRGILPEIEDLADDILVSVRQSHEDLSRIRGKL